MEDSGIRAPWAVAHVRQNTGDFSALGLGNRMKCRKVLVCRRCNRRFFWQNPAALADNPRARTMELCVI
jgi:hypothetical protein